MAPLRKNLYLFTIKYRKNVIDEISILDSERGLLKYQKQPKLEPDQNILIRPYNLDSTITTGPDHIT